MICPCHAPGWHAEDRCPLTPEGRANRALDAARDTVRTLLRRDLRRRQREWVIETALALVRLDLRATELYLSLFMDRESVTVATGHLRSAIEDHGKRVTP